MKRLIAVSGPSGAGKGSVLTVLRGYPKKYQFTVSCTTRSPRPGEDPGVNYHFISLTDFEQLIKDGEFAEYEKVHDNFYGTKRSELEAIWQSGKVPIVEIDVKGVANLKKQFPDQVVSIFIEPPSFEILAERLKSRGTEDEVTRQLRLSRYEEEMSYQSQYDHVIINDSLERAQSDLLTIISQL